MDDMTDQLGGPLVLVAGSEDVLRHPDAGRYLLTDIESERAERFRREEDRRNFVAAHFLVRLCAERLLGVPAAPTLAQYCQDCGLHGHGKPYLPDHPDVHVSLSHTRGVVAAAAGYHPVGVDVELPQHDGADPGVLQRVLTEAERWQVERHADPARAFLRQWVRKEALIKIGRVTLDTMADVDLSGLPLGEADGALLRSRFEDLHFLDWDDEKLGATLVAVSTAAPRLGSLTEPGPSAAREI
ncbi:4'-phosphopantetheinyl transferase superfamily protein [Kitasatospora sp. MAP5-34]|uniref:4'-phosphopantetheinyl transferase family protein n=1 Tax=Kitasatospora sp. MAP5-34 TaxID=3035102 RepID=UPI0024763299|nr:4'-phosphopantetheinyl transferase superfamily protein [Kitasatospora sp. MAP5-34]MDH6578965.1 4'-phosphopantetheinyl transferase [Kitasatospora sp. MAP5-34]